MTAQTSQRKKYKIVIIGDDDYGRTKYITKIWSAHDVGYHPFGTYEIRSLLFHTNHGDISVKAWNSNGHFVSVNITNHVYKNADAFIVFLSRDEADTMTYLEDLKGVVPSDIPGVLVWNMDYGRIPYYAYKLPQTLVPISVEREDNFYIPIIYLLREMAKDLSLSINDHPGQSDEEQNKNKTNEGNKEGKKHEEQDNKELIREEKRILLSQKMAESIRLNNALIDIKEEIRIIQEELLWKL